MDDLYALEGGGSATAWQRKGGPPGSLQSNCPAPSKGISRGKLVEPSVRSAPRDSDLKLCHCLAKLF